MSDFPPPAGKAFALLIGCADYSVFDAARGNPAGSSDLAGAVNDVRSFAGVAAALGVQPSQLRVLSSPGLGPAELPGRDWSGAHCASATRENILAGFHWLAEALGADEAAQGLVLFSGHGDVRDGEGVICPSDTGACLEGAIGYGELLALMDGHHVQSNLTVVLDTCHVGRTLSGGDSPAPTTALARLRRSFVVLAASELDSTAHQVTIQGRPHGLFSYAISTLLGRFGLEGDDTQRWFAISYEELMSRAALLMTALGFDQRPHLEGPWLARQLPVLRLLALAEANLWRLEQDDDGKELHPDLGSAYKSGNLYKFTVYDIFDAAGSSIIGKVYYTWDGYMPSPWQSSRQYWVWNSGSFPSSTFRLVTNLSASLPSSIPSGAIVFEAASFATGTPHKSYTPNTSTGTFFALKRKTANGSTAKDYGWLKQHDGNTKLNWYQWSTGGVVDNYLSWDANAGEYLACEHVSSPSTPFQNIVKVEDDAI